MRITAIVLLFSLPLCNSGLSQEQHTLETIAGYFEKQEEAKEPPFMPVLDLTYSSKIGHVGRLNQDRRNYRVSQQIPEGTLVLVDRSADYRYVTDSRGTHKVGEGPLTLGPYLFKDKSIASIPDSFGLDPIGNYKITGLYAYQTVAGGSNSVLIVEPLSEEEFKSPKLLPSILLYKHEIKTWTDGKGNEVAKGIYLGYRSPDVWILDLDANVVKASLLSLREDDRKFVRKRIKDKKTREHLIPQFEKKESARLERLKAAANRP